VHFESQQQVWNMPMSILPIAAISWSAIMASLLGSVAMDIKERIIPNGYVLVIAVAGTALRFGTEGPSAWISVLAAAAVFLVLIVLSNLGVMGGGDAKLIAAVTLLAAPNRVAFLILCVALAGGMVACLYLLARAWLSSPSRRFIASDLPGEIRHRPLYAEAARILAGEPMPYALAVLGGVVLFSIIEVTQCVSVMSCSS
jgi:prepilin peptidase CpaA